MENSNALFAQYLARSTCGKRPSMSTENVKWITMCRTSFSFKGDAHFIAMRAVVSMAMLLPVLAASRLRGARVGMNGIPLQYQRCWTFSLTSWSSPDSHAHARRLNHKGSTACAAVCQPILPLRGLLVLCEPVVPLANEARRNWSHMKEEKWHRRRFLVFEADR